MCKRFLQDSIRHDRYRLFITMWTNTASQMSHDKMYSITHLQMSKVNEKVKKHTNMYNINISKTLIIVTNVYAHQDKKLY